MLLSLILRAERIYMADGRQLRKPAKKEDIVLTLKLAREKFNVELPNDYVEFLKFRNGFWFEGLSIYHAKFTNIADLPDDMKDVNIIDQNDAWREGELGKWYRDYFFFGQSNLDLFALNLKTKEYEQQDKTCGEVIEKFQNFTSMMIPALTAYVESMENK